MIQAIRPRLIGTPSAINQTAQRLADFAQSMVQAEQVRRSKPAPAELTANTRKAVKKTVLKAPKAPKAPKTVKAVKYLA